MIPDLPLVKEATCFIQVLEIRQILLRSQPFKRTDLKIAPEMAKVVCFHFLIVVKPLTHAGVTTGHPFRMLLNPFLHVYPEGCQSGWVISQR